LRAGRQARQQRVQRLLQEGAVTDIVRIVPVQGVFGPLLFR
jgi:hypothetical protein